MPDAAAVLAWTAARDAALRGLVHALGNRVGTVAAVGGMLGDGASAASVDTAGRVLASEGERLEALLAHLRLATADPFGDDAAPEPLHVPELAAEVVALAVAAGWDVVADPSGGDAPPPAMASRAAVAHAALVLLHAAHAAAGGPVTLAAARDGGRPVLRLTAGAGGAAAAAARAACAWLLGNGAVDAEGVELRLPPLGGW